MAASRGTGKNSHNRQVKGENLPLFSVLTVCRFPFWEVILKIFFEIFIKFSTAVK
jgi:hypothetical protein